MIRAEPAVATDGDIARTGVAIATSAITALFVPGNRADRFGKAAASGADVVIIDLEDAVPPGSKTDALAAMITALSPVGGQNVALRALVRVNTADSPFFEPELAALMRLTVLPGHGLLGLLLPKSEDAAVVRRVRGLLSADLALIPLVESAAGVVNALELARVAGVTRLAFGAIDFALDIDSAASDEFLAYTRSQLVVVSRAAGIMAPLDSPVMDIQDTERVAASAQLARDFGFGGKLCIHPAQLAFVRGAFRPSVVDIEWAKSLAEAGDGASQVNGQMVDRPVLERAKRILQYGDR